MATGIDLSKWKAPSLRTAMLRLSSFRLSRRLSQVLSVCLILICIQTYQTYKLFRAPVVNPKTVLWYYPPRYLPNNMNGLAPFTECPHLQCFMTRNRSYLPTSDAVIFSAEHINESVLPFRTPGQIWIFHNNEPPYHFAVGRPFHKSPWSSAFNWTMDFRYDSDIVRPYAKLRKRSQAPSKDYIDIVNRKTNLVAIMVSNCDNWSGRLDYARELNKTISVDIYGRCGKHLYPREKHEEWVKYLNDNYKFYLAFENLYCLDYISEKFFNNFNLDLVTIARGGGNYSRDVPQGTFINVADYKSPADLGNYLLRLHKNPAEYIDVMKKKDMYYYESEAYFYIDSIKQNYREHYYERKPLCELCRRLKNLKKYSKTIPDIVPWFKKGVCIKRGM